MTARKRMQLRVPEWMYAALKNAADRDGQTMNSIIIGMLRAKLTDATEEESRNDSAG